MYSKVVVPLDGSKLGEVALPHLEEIAQKFAVSEIFLVSVTAKLKGMIQQDKVFDMPSPRADTPSPVKIATVQTGVIISAILREGSLEIPLTLGKMAKTAFDYLYRKGKQLDQKGFNVSIHVLIGNPAEELLKFVEEQKADLIVMASKGRSGLSRWDMSNIARKVVSAAKVPVMIVKPGPDFKETKPKRKGVAS
jgi:nucleotide-binding universal stress UspA family protein